MVLRSFARGALEVADIEKDRLRALSWSNWRTIVVLPLPEGAENTISLPKELITKRLVLVLLFFRVRLSFEPQLVAWAQNLIWSLWC